MASTMLFPRSSAQVQVLPTNCVPVLRIDDTPEIRAAVVELRRQLDPQQELPFPRAPQPEQLCLKF